VAEAMEELMQAQPGGQSQHESYELFRRAIVERDEQAWIDSAARYRPLLAAWASRCSASAALTESYEDLADQAFARAWSALSPERFASFPTLAAVLAYMRACVTTTVIDHARSELSRERIEQSIEANDVSTPEQQIMDQFQRQEVWRLAEAAVVSEQERVVLRETFVYDLPPRAILRRHPELYADAHAIYTTKRNFFDRLPRCAELRQVYQDWQGA
jgi:DNA-directed RNA polymerase specialized sigma24 family protein